jgi:hypothetical protein
VIKRLTSGQGWTDAGAQPDYVWVLDVTEPKKYLSVHWSEDGAYRQRGLLADEWGVEVDDLSSTVTRQEVDP